MREQAKPGAAPLRLEDVTDWYIPETDERELLVYPGAVLASGELAEHGRALREMVLWRQSQEQTVLQDWRVEYRGLKLRAHRQRTVDGVMYILRRISTEMPQLSALGLPPEIVKLVTRPNFGEQGGLVLVSGMPGHGKSTTAAAIVSERVRQFGCFGLTVEDPPEFSLHGDYPSRNGRIGKIVQVPANGSSFAVDLHDALRCYPASMRGSMLMVGEVRDGATAAELLRSACNGQLVLATFHASDPIATLERVLSMAKEVMGADEARSLLAHALRAVLQQRLVAGRLYMDSLLSMSSSSTVAARIRSGHLEMLGTDLQQQKVNAQNGRLLESLAVHH